MKIQKQTVQRSVSKNKNLNLKIINIVWKQINLQKKSDQIRKSNQTKKG